MFGTANNRNFGGLKDVFGFSSSTLANAITANDYMTFSVTPENGESFDLESFTFRGYYGQFDPELNQYGIDQGGPIKEFLI